MWDKVQLVSTSFRSHLLSALIGLCFTVIATFAEARTTTALINGLTQAQLLYRSTTVSLRTGRPEEAAASLKALIAMWDETAELTAAEPPPIAARVNLFAEVMKGGRARLRRAAEVLALGRPDSALEELAPLKREWIGMRRSIGLYGLVECLEESSEAIEALMVHRRQPADLARGETRGDIIAKAAVYRFALRRCEAFAALDPVGNGEFRRQAEAIAAALDVIDSALRLRDPTLLERVLGDLRTFDLQLSQRFGG